MSLKQLNNSAVNQLGTFFIVFLLKPDTVSQSQGSNIWLFTFGVSIFLSLSQRRWKIDLFELKLNRGIFLPLDFRAASISFTLSFVEDDVGLHKSRFHFVFPLTDNRLHLLLLRKLVLFLRTGKTLRKLVLNTLAQFFRAQKHNDLLTGTLFGFDWKTKAIGLPHKLLIATGKSVLNERGEESRLLFWRKQ